MCQGRHCPALPLSLVSLSHTHTHTHSSYGVTTKMEVQPFPAQWSFCVSPCLRQSAVGLSPRWPNFDPRSVHMRFMVDKVALWQVSSPSTSVFPCQYHSTYHPHPFIHLPPTLYNVSLPVPQFSPVSTIPPTLHTHSFTYHPHYIIFLSQYFSFPLSVSFHQSSIPIHSPTTHAI